jgi:hypothetical protein
MQEVKDFLNALLNTRGEPKKIMAVMKGEYIVEPKETFLEKKARLQKLGWEKVARLAKAQNISTKSKDGDDVLIEIEQLPDWKQKETYLKHYMNGNFEIDGVYFNQLDPVEQSKIRIKYNDLRYS